MLIRDIFILAHAKLKTKRIMTLMAILIAGALFSLLFASLILKQGIEQSFILFNQKSSQQRFSVIASPVVPREINRSMGGYFYMSDEKDKQAYDKIMQQFNEYVKEQQTLAKQHQIDFDPSSIAPPFRLYKGLSTIAHTYVYNTDSPFVKQLFEQQQRNFAKTATNTVDVLRQKAEQHHALDSYDTVKLILNPSNGNFFANNQEDYLRIGKDKDFSGSDPVFGQTAVRESYIGISGNDPSLERFILEPNDKRQQQDDHIPILITAHEAQKLFAEKYNLPQEPAEPSAKVAWIKQLRQKLNGETFTICYRNNAEMARVSDYIDQNVITEQKDANGNVIKNTAEPSIVYGHPTAACQPLTIAKDNRSAAQKRSDDNYRRFQQKIGEYQEPITKPLKFQIVGLIALTASANGHSPKDIPSLAQSLFSSNFYGAIIPQKLYQTSRAQQIYGQLFDQIIKDQQGVFDQANIRNMIVDFPTISDAKAFLSKDCPGNFADFDRPACDFGFDIEPTGKNYLLYESVENNVLKITQIAFLMISVIAGIILCLTMARIIVDSRHETAIFRAIGARRGHIVAIYVTYSFLVACRMIVASVIIAGILVAFVQWRWSGLLTDLAQLSWNLFDHDARFNLYGFNWAWLAAATLSVIAITLVAIIIPLLSNSKRNPITDIRDN